MCVCVCVCVLQKGSQEKHTGHSGAKSSNLDHKGEDAWEGKKGSEFKYSDRENLEDFDRHKHSDKYKYGREDDYRHTPGFYSWG